MATVIDGNKAKTARRVIEVLEFFDEHHRHATVMDIVRRYNRPQSSTSELLASLVELGLLYKDANSRSYTLTPRAAILGSLSQPSLVRDGRLSTMIDRLVAQTGLCTVLLGMVGLNAQIFRWTVGSKYVPAGADIVAGGAQDRLCDSAAGWLLLSTLASDRREGVIRRLNAEASAERKFNHAAMSQQVQACRQQEWAVGPAGFDTNAQMCAVLLPNEPGERPMALGFVYQPTDQIDPANLVNLLQKSVDRCCVEQECESASIEAMAPVAPNSITSAFVVTNA